MQITWGLNPEFLFFKMLLEFAIGKGIEVVTTDDSGLDRKYNGVLMWPEKDGTMRILIGDRTLDIPYTSIAEYKFLKKNQ